MIGTIGDRVGQFGKNGEYWVWRKGSGLIWYSKLQDGSPRLCRLGPTSVGSEWTSIWNVMAHTKQMESPNLVASWATETEVVLPYLTGVQWDRAWATHGVSIEAYMWKTCTRVRWALIVSLTASWIVATNGSSLPACVMLSGLYPCKVDFLFESPWHPRTWVMTCSSNLSVELSTSQYYDENYMDWWLHYSHGLC
jgi:hypothetical protein